MTSFKKDRFDLEQAIMNAWGTSEDLDLVYHNTDNLRLNSKDCDMLQNQMLGLKYLFELRMEKVWSIFVELIEQEQFKADNEEQRCYDESVDCYDAMQLELGFDDDEIYKNY
jgi:hypothetical protein